MQEHDIAIIGAGPSGLTAASFSSSRGLKTVIFESGTAGGLLKTLYPEKIVINYPGYASGIKASTLADEFLNQALSYGAEIINERVVELTKDKIITTESGEKHRAKAVIIACGSRSRELGVKGEAEFNYGDRGVYYYATDKEKFRRKKVAIIGGGNAAIDAALDIADFADKIFLIHRREKFRAIEKNVEKVMKKKNVEIITNAELREIAGSERVEKIKIVKKLETESKKHREEIIDVSAVIIAIGMIPNTEIFRKTGIELDEEGKIIVDAKQETNIKGIFAAGDVVSGTGSLELITVACAQGAIAAHYAYLQIV